MTQNWIFKQIRYLPSDSFDVHIICERTKNREHFEIPNIHELGSEKGWQYWHQGVARKLGLRNRSKFSDQCRDLKAKLVHSHFGDVGWKDLRALRGCSAKHIVSFYGYDVGQLPITAPIWRERYRELFSKVDRVLCEGAFMREAIIRLGCAAEKVEVQRLGIEVNKICFAPRQWTPGLPLRVLMVGRFVEKKGLPDALAALARIRRDVEVEATIIGDAGSATREQQEKSRIVRIIETNNMSNYVRLLGFQPYQRIFEEAYSHDVFLSPSVFGSDGDSEGGLPVTLIEMMASGMPIVSTRHCDIPSVVLSGQTGLLAEEHDIDGLVGHLRWLVEHPKDWQPMLAAGRRHVEMEFDAAVQGRKLGQIYNAILQ